MCCYYGRGVAVHEMGTRLFIGLTFLSKIIKFLGGIFLL